MNTNQNKLIEHIANHLEMEVICLYAYGSQVYGTAGPESDYDYIAIVDANHEVEDQITGRIIIETASKSVAHGSTVYDFDVSVYDRKTFATKIAAHDIAALECLSLSIESILVLDCPFDCEIDLKKLRSSISATASNSWVKAKKKVVQGDFYIGKKSLFHSLRILRFGIQIAEHGRIVDFASCNDIWRLIRDWPEEITVDIIKEVWQPMYNAFSSEFRIVAPK